MSGGSFGYLGRYAEWGETQEHLGSVKGMAKALDDLGEPAALAAAQTREILALATRIDALGKELAEVWTDMEWWHSGDSGMEEVLASLTLFNERQAHPVQSDLSGLAAREAQAPVQVPK